jgi:hypothetical protein
MEQVMGSKKVLRVVLALIPLLSVVLAGCSSQQYAQDGISRARQQEPLSLYHRRVEYSIRDSVDATESKYIRYSSWLPSVLTFVNGDGSVTVCTSDENAKITYIYEYSADLEELKTLSFQNELGSLGAFAKDNDGNYYFFYGARAANQNAENMALVKYSPEGEKTNAYKLKAKPPNSFDGIRIPFDAGTCRLELAGSMLAVYFAREMFSGHQASYGFILNKDTFERVDRGAATHPDMGGNTQMPYVSHSFNQFILPVDGGFVFADHGDAYPRSFTFAKFQNGSNTKRLHAFRFPGGVGANATYAEMGGMAKTSTGYIFAGAYGTAQNNSRNLFALTFDENMTKCSAPVYLTKYTREDGHAGHPKIVSLNDGRYLLLWEAFGFSTQAANLLAGGTTGYRSTYMLIIDEKGGVISDVQELAGIRLNINDTLRYNPLNGKVYWAINDSAASITVYALDVDGRATALSQM